MATQELTGQTSNGPITSNSRILAAVNGISDSTVDLISPSLIYDFIKTQTDTLYPTQGQLSSLDDYVSAFTLQKNSSDNTKWDGQSLIARGFADGVLDSDLATVGQITALSSALTVGTTIINGGTSGQVLYNNAGVVGQYATIPVANGGTNLASYTAGDLLYASGATTLSKLAIGSANTILTSSGTAPQWSTSTSVTALLDAFTGDSGSGGVKGLVPAPASGDAAANKFLHAGGTWTPLFSAANTWTALQTFTRTDYAARFINTQDAGSFIEVARFEGDRATPTNGDGAYLGFYLSNDAGTQKEAARMSWYLTDVANGSEDSIIIWNLLTGGSAETYLRLDTTALSPAVNNFIALGTSSLKWADLFLASGAVINFDAGDVTVTHSSNALSVSGGSLVLGVQQTEQGALVLSNTAAGAYATTVQGSNSASAAWTLTLPTSAGSNGQALTTNGSGVTTWTTIVTAPGGSTTQVQYNNAGAFAGDSGFTYSSTNKAITLGGATVTASAPVLDLSQTWNSGGTTFTGLKLNVTNSASASASLLVDVQRDGSSRFKVDRSGNLTMTTDGDGVFTIYSGANIKLQTYFQTPRQIAIASDVGLGWSSSTSVSGANDLVLARDAANTLALRNSTNAQTFNWYFSYTDGSNYARGALKTASGYVEMAAETAGTGADDINVKLTPAGTGTVQFGTHSAIAAETVTGYITITDAGGTTRKLAVVS